MSITINNYILIALAISIVFAIYSYYKWAKGKDITWDVYANALLISICWPIVLISLLIAAAGISILWVLKKLEVKGKIQSELHIDKVVNRTNIPKHTDYNYDKYKRGYRNS